MFQTAKVTFKINQGHLQWCHSMGHIPFPIRIPQQCSMSLSCTVFEILSLISQNLKSHVTLITSLSAVIYHSCTSTPLYQSADHIRSDYFHWSQRHDWGKI